MLEQLGGSPPLDTRSDNDRDGAPDFFEDRVRHAELGPERFFTLAVRPL